MHRAARVGAGCQRGRSEKYTNETDDGQAEIFHEDAPLVALRAADFLTAADFLIVVRLYHVHARTPSAVRVSTGGGGNELSLFSRRHRVPACPAQSEVLTTFGDESKERESMSLAVPSPKSFMLRRIIGALAIAIPIAAYADDPPPGWSGKGQAGYLMSRGNSDADSANGILDVNLVQDAWKHELTLDGLYGKSAGIVSAERWDVREQSSYAITTNLFSFGALSYQDDKFSGFQYQASATGGIGYKFINTSTTKLAAQIGVGYRALRPEELIKDDTGAVVQRIPQQSDSSVVGTAGVDFEQDFNPNTKLTDKLIVDSGSANTQVTNALALEVKMSKKLSLAAGYGIVNNSKPPAGLKKLDSTTTLNLVYAFPEPKS
jgi:putative salt-induced outer membrane protein